MKRKGFDDHQTLQRMTSNTKERVGKDLKIISIHILRGKNIHSHKPVTQMTVDIGVLNDIPTKDIPGFHERLLRAFPGLLPHTCGLGYPGGFLDRLWEGTYIGHVLEHVILDIQNTLGFDVKYGKTRQVGQSTQYCLTYEYENEVCAYEISIAAVFILNRFIADEETDTAELLAYLREIRDETELGPSTAAIVREAKLRNIPVTRIGYESLVRLGHGQYGKLVQATLTDRTSCISADISANKQFTKYILSGHQIPVPYGKVVYTAHAAVLAANEIGLPVAVKPQSANQGKGVRTDLKDAAAVAKAFTEAAKYNQGVIVERFIPGNDYRVLVVGGVVTAVARRLPAMVVGDDRHTIAELVEIVNQDPNRGEGHEKPLTKIRLDETALTLLRQRGLTPSDRPKEGQVVILRENCNLSTGGVAIDCTDEIHPENAAFAIRAAKAIGIDIAGIDIVAEDIGASIAETNGAVIEVNAAPGLRMHLAPSKGTPRNAAKAIVDFLFPPDQPCSLPIVSVTGTNGKTSTVRLISHVLSVAGKKVGMTSTGGTYIDGRRVAKGDNSGPNSAGILLADKSIDVAVFETARGGILREGLGYDLADVGVITNITEDHLGIDGIHTLADMAHVKSLVAEAVKPEGCAVLNAEDAMTARIAAKLKGRFLLFYKDESAVRMEGISQYTRVFVDSEGVIQIIDNDKKHRVAPVRDIPVTADGLLACNIDNCLAATAALYALGIPVETIANGLTRFHHNPGRFQMIPMADFSVMLDYAHNYAGYEEVAKFCKQSGFRRFIGVIGMPGDRPESVLRSVGALAADVFDRVVIKEDKDPRGRVKGAVADLLFESLLKAGRTPEEIQIIPEETAALRHALSLAEPNDLIVVLYEEIEPLLDLLLKEPRRVNKIVPQETAMNKA